MYIVHVWCTRDYLIVVYSVHSGYKRLSELNSTPCTRLDALLCAFSILLLLLLLFLLFIIIIEYTFKWGGRRFCIAWDHLLDIAYILTTTPTLPRRGVGL